MKCGHIANATDSNGKPCYVICAGISSGFLTYHINKDYSGGR